MAASLTRRIRRLVIVTATTLAAATLTLIGPAPTANAALASIQPPAGPSCDVSRAQLVVAPPRAYTSFGTDQVVWVSQIQRYNSVTGQWYVYDTFTNWASFQNTGLSMTSWSVLNNTRGGMYVNNYMRYPVSHVGYYRILSSIQGNRGGITWTGYISGGRYCYMS
jgi:hypothetical protein